MGINGPERSSLTPELANFLDGVEGSPYGGSLSCLEAYDRSLILDDGLVRRRDTDDYSIGEVAAGIGLAGILFVVDKIGKLKEITGTFLKDK